MAGVLSKGRSGLKFYWRRYQKLDGSSSSRYRRVHRAELGDGRRPFWRRRIRIKIRPRLRLFRRFSIKRILAKIRDAYVNMMLGLASSNAINAYGYGYGFGAGDAAEAAFGRLPRKEYDEKMIVEIYKSIIAQGQMFATGGAGVVAAPPSASQIAVRR